VAIIDIMGLDFIANSVWKNKIGIRQKRLKKNPVDARIPLVSLGDYLTAANNAALNYFKNNRNPLRKLWEYHGLKPRCGSHSTYTYAAFLSLTEAQNRTELQNDVRWAGGNYYIPEEVMGCHAWLEKKTDGYWEIFETIPHMADIAAQYIPFCTFQMNQNKIETISESFLGLLLHTIFGFANS
jgi:hypothetical protein